MLPRAYEDENCSIAASLGVVGDRWTLLILRDASRGVTRFADFQNRLGLARTVLTDRLNRLTAHGIFDRVRYQERPERFEYRLTKKGKDLWPVLNALRSWGDHYVMDDKPPVLIRHRDCGGLMDDRGFCTACGIRMELDDAIREDGPGATVVAPGRRR